MKGPLKVGIIGDFDPGSPSHRATNEALEHSARHLAVALDHVWIPTPSLDRAGEAILDRFDALWCAPGSPYASMNGALRGIQFARERDLPFLGT